MKSSRMFLSFVVWALVAVSVNAKDFSLRTLKHASNPTFDMTKGNQISYYNYVHKLIGPAMLEISGKAKPGFTNEDELEAGRGISVRLSENNYNIHINFPKKPTGGRSYGWTSGQVGDWSDKMYLEEVYKVTSQKDEQDIADFYTLIVNLLGRSDPKGIDQISNQSQRVAANFLAIYTAEQYRSMVPDPHHNWDDALLQATLLAAFHGGQSEFAMIYTGKFTGTTKQQDSGVYYRGRPGPVAAKARDQKASMKDYWQFSHKLDSKQSGINITRNDFTKMGKAITKYEKSIKSKKLAAVEAIVGRSSNVIQAITVHFARNRSKVANTDKLAAAVSALMLEIRDNADAMSKTF